PNDQTSFTLTYSIPAKTLQEMIIAEGGMASVGFNYMTTGKYGFEVVLSGFIVSEGITIDINEKLKV
ncbi:MAG: hypothetical protein HRT72_10690, partial [Flavobacteriales bacterium]|nr:hypothetical protein [Flavobacteriales bacterium]